MTLILSTRPENQGRREEPILRRLLAVVLAAMIWGNAGLTFAGSPKLPNPDVVRAKVEKLGVGEHVMVKRTKGPKLHGHIIGIDEQTFKLKPDKAQADVVIPYADVQKIKKNPGPIMWMLVGAVLVIIIIAATR
jgi:sporulation protein YlmC with PRC-barrel domain